MSCCDNMNNRSSLHTIKFIMWLVPRMMLMDVMVSATCPSHQYAKLGESATIECRINTLIYNVYWYKSADSNKDPFIRYEDGTVQPISGRGFSSASYSISHNGSLIIFDVKLSDEGTYRVLSYNRIDGVIEEHYIVVHIYDMCGQEFPLIDICKNQKTCLIGSDNLKSLNCSIGCAGPVELRWHIKHEEYIQNMEDIRTEALDGEFMTSISNIEIYKYLNEPLMHFVCKAQGPAIGSQILESSVFIDNFSGWKKIEYASKYYSINTQAVMPCVNGVEPSIYIWEKSTGNVTTVLMFSESGRQHIDTTKFPWSVSERGVLVLSQVDLTSEGTYRCKFFDGDMFGISEHILTVLVAPSPPFLLVDGCPQSTQPCSIEINPNIVKLSLTCSVSEVYPQLSLEFENDFLLNMKETNSITKRNNRYFVRASAELHLLHESFTCDDEIFIICRASGPGASAMVNPEKKIQLSWGGCKVTDTSREINISMVWIAGIPLVCIVVLAIFVCCWKNKTYSRARTYDSDVRVI